MSAGHARGARDARALDLARRDTLVLLAVLAEPGADMSTICTATRLPRSAVNSTLRRLEGEDLVVRRFTIDERGHAVRSYPIAPPDPAAKAKLRNLTTTHAAPADIRSVA